MGWTDTASRSNRSGHKAPPKESELKSLELFDWVVVFVSSVYRTFGSPQMMLAGILNREESREVFRSGF